MTDQTQKQQEKPAPKIIFEGRTAMGAVRKDRPARVRLPFKPDNNDDL